LLGLLQGSSARKATVGFEQGEGFSLERRQLDATTQRFAVAFNEGKKRRVSWMSGSREKDGMVNSTDVSDPTLLFGTSAQLWELPHSRSSTEDKSVLTCKVYK
jgi:hypothetical protein